MVNHPNKWQTFIYGLLIAAGILIGVYLSPGRQAASIQSGENKISEILNLIKQSYVDTVNIEEVEKKSIEDLLSNLDPHSVYIPAADLKMANEQLEGNFEGIGVEFNILHDTIMIVSALNGGPAQSLGIQSGDRIVQVDTIPVASKGITSDRVFKLLRGKGGTEVDVLGGAGGFLSALLSSLSSNDVSILS
jgi:carboxyl-terminal processing protease